MEDNRETRDAPTKRRWSVTSLSATLAAVITIFAFVTGYQTIPDFFGAGDTASPADGDTVLPAEGNAASAADGDTASPGDAPAIVDPAESEASVQAQDQRRQPYPIDVAIESVRVTSGQTHVRLSLTNRGPVPLGYLYSVYSLQWHPDEWRFDRFPLRVDDGPPREVAEQRGLVEQELGRGRHSCLDLPSGVAAAFTLVYEGESDGDVAILQHAPLPRMLGFRGCDDTTIVLPQFELRAPITR